MKKLVFIALAVLNVLALNSCGKENNDSSDNEGKSNNTNNQTNNNEEQPTIPSNYYVLSPDGKTLMQWFNTEAKIIDMQADKVLRNVTHISATFGNCKKLTSIILPKGLVSLGHFTFGGCEALESIEIPCLNIPEYSFYNCKSLSSVTFLKDVYSIGTFAFYNSGVTSITLTNRTIGINENTVTKIEPYAFAECKNLTSVTFPAYRIWEIKDGVFQGCKKLKNITIPDSLKIIGKHAFYNTGLSSITISKGVYKIDDLAFYNCKSLNTVTLKTSTLIEIGSQVFDSDNSFLTIFVPHNMISWYKDVSKWKKYAGKIQAIP